MQQYSNIPRVVIGAPQGRSGKTTVTLGLISALLARGLKVQAFKKGPDFIDPSWLSKLTGRPCRNLDTFLMERDVIRSSFAEGCLDADIAIVEGAMGLFDGVDVVGSGSTAEIAKVVKSPVILVVNATRMTRSVAATVCGFADFDEDVHIGGIILNKVARPRHENMLRASIEKYCDVPVIGAVPKGETFIIPDRHLGLIPADEDDKFFKPVGEMGKAIEQHLDLDKLLDIAKTAETLKYTSAGEPAKIRHGARIGVIRDRSFSFYYPENIEALASLGARLVFMDALVDKHLPPVDALYIGGGFPEIFARDLEKNSSFRHALRQKIEEGLPVYAEGGGLMYLGRKLYWNGKGQDMVGALPYDVEMVNKPRGHGYVVTHIQEENPYLECGATVKAHEFHHSQIVNLDRSKVRFAHEIKRGWGIDGRNDGILYRNVLASYSHIHASSATGWAANLVKKAASFREGKH
ncbi:MAG TPA: cobyrinate a,c-diamide synthase [Clostridia bacterium]|nr:cobyrinate a,c-diamide synthase [Clostridia bacterium]